MQNDELFAAMQWLDRVQGNDNKISKEGRCDYHLN